MLGLLGGREGEKVVPCEDRLYVGFAWWSRGGKVVLCEDRLYVGFAWWSRGGKGSSV